MARAAALAARVEDAVTAGAEAGIAAAAAAVARATVAGTVAARTAAVKATVMDVAEVAAATATAVDQVEPAGDEIATDAAARAIAAVGADRLATAGGATMSVGTTASAQLRPAPKSGAAWRAGARPG